MKREMVFAGIAVCLVLIVVIIGGVATLMQRSAAGPVTPIPIRATMPITIIETAQANTEFQTTISDSLTPVVITPQPGVSTLTATEWSQHATTQANPTIHALNAIVYACNNGDKEACKFISGD